MTDGDGARCLVGVLAEPSRLRAFSALVLGASREEEVAERAQLSPRDAAEPAAARRRPAWS